jgi:hypothetical protein
VVTRHGCRRAEFFEGCETRCGESGIHATSAASAADGDGGQRKRNEPLAGCGAQQTHSSFAEETVEVVRNHEDGTCGWPWWLAAEAALSGVVGVDASREMSAGREREFQKRRD